MQELSDKGFKVWTMKAGMHTITRPKEDPQEAARGDTVRRY